MLRLTNANSMLVSRKQPIFFRSRYSLSVKCQSKDDIDGLMKQERGLILKRERDDDDVLVKKKEMEGDAGFKFKEEEEEEEVSWKGFEVRKEKKITTIGYGFKFGFALKMDIHNFKFKRPNVFQLILQGLSSMVYKGVLIGVKLSIVLLALMEENSRRRYLSTSNDKDMRLLNHYLSEFTQAKDDLVVNKSYKDAIVIGEDKNKQNDTNLPRVLPESWGVIGKYGDGVIYFLSCVAIVWFVIQYNKIKFPKLPKFPKLTIE